MGALMRAHDWSSTSLGPPDAWPQGLRTALRLLLNTGHPMYIWWGPELLCFYNDAYRVSIGPERHPDSLGQPGRKVWEEIWPIIGPQIEHVMAGEGATWHVNHLVPITRHGRLEEVYWTYSYGPIDDEDASNGVGGVLVVCTETTATVLAERRRAEEAERQRKLFEQAPGFITILSGPDHRFEFVNKAYTRVFGDRDFIGKTVREVFPELAGQGFYEWLDDVYKTRARFVAQRVSIWLQSASSSAPEQRYLDFIYEPVTDESNEVSGIFCEGFDVTEAYIAQEALRKSEDRLRFLDRLTELTQPLTSATEIMAVTAQHLGEHLGVAVCAYADMEPDEDGFTIRGDWTAPGATSIVGFYALSAFGDTAVRELRAGRPLVTRDTLAELGPAQASLFLQLGLKATVCMPLVKEDRLTALMAVHSAEPRDWSETELLLIADTTARSWAHIERTRSEAGLRESEARFRNMADHAPAMIWTTDPTGSCTYLNRPWYEFTGQSEEETKGFGWLDAVHPDDRGWSGETFFHANAAREAFRLEYRLRNAEGISLGD